MAARKAAADSAPAGDVRKPAFRIKVGTLKSALGAVAQVIEARNTVPICSMVRIHASDGILTLAGTNLDVFAERTLATDDREPNSDQWRASIRALSTCVPAHALLAILGAIDADAMVTLETETDGGPVLVRAGRGRWTLNALPVADFPEAGPTPWACHFAMKASALVDALAVVDHAISTEPTRYYLNGVYWHAEGFDLRFAATDGARLARIAIDAPDGAASTPSFIMPRGVVQLLGKLLPKAGEDALITIEINEAGSRLFFEVPDKDDGTLTIQAKTIDGTFPDYTRVIPEAPAHGLTVEREALLTALRGVAVLATKDSNAVKVDVSEGRLTLSARAPEIGEAVQELPCTYGGPDQTIGFNGKYWREALEAIASDEVRLRFDDPGAPVRIEGVTGEDAPRLVQVLMPMRV